MHVHNQVIKFIYTLSCRGLGKACETQDSRDIKINVQSLSWSGSCLWQPDRNKWWRDFKAKFSPNTFQYSWVLSVRITSNTNYLLWLQWQSMLNTVSLMLFRKRIVTFLCEETWVNIFNVSLTFLLLLLNYFSCHIK